MKHLKRLSPLEQSALYRQLSDLLAAGLPLAVALKMAASQAANPQLQRILKSIAQNVRAGQSLSKALELEGPLFPQFHIRLIYSAETNAALHSALRRLADMTERDEDISAQVKSALAYPAFIVIVGTATVFFILAFVIPRMAGMWADFNSNLPIPTRALLRISHWLRGDAWVLIFPMGAAYLYLWRTQSRDKLNEFRDRLIISTPWLKSWALKREIGLYARTLGMLLKSDVPVLQALSAASGAARNIYFKHRVADFATRVRQGFPISHCLESSGLFPADACNLVRAGEQSGQAGENLLKIADTYDRQSLRELKTAVSLLEPMLILAIGAILGGVVVAVLLPIFEMNELVR